MKKLTCRDLGGPCDHEITGESFEEMGQHSKAHVMEQIAKGDQAHIEAVEKMKNAKPEQQKTWMEEFEKKFTDAPEV